MVKVVVISHKSRIYDIKIEKNVSVRFLIDQYLNQKYQAQIRNDGLRVTMNGQEVTNLKTTIVADGSQLDITCS